MKDMMMMMMMMVYSTSDAHSFTHLSLMNVTESLYNTNFYTNWYLQGKLLLPLILILHLVESSLTIRTLKRNIIHGSKAEKTA